MSKAGRKTRLSKNQRLVLKGKLRTAQDGKCCYCGRTMLQWSKTCPKGGLPKDAETLEHLKRIDDGGTNAPDNLALSCHECNLGRGALDWLTYKSLKSGELFS
jgi:5-methylcytosine-specific restriction endonuclease McrA